LLYYQTIFLNSQKCPKLLSK